jgi:hypothetical protein
MAGREGAIKITTAIEANFSLILARFVICGRSSHEGKE